MAVHMILQGDQCYQEMLVSWGGVNLLWQMVGESCIHMNARIEGFPTDYCPLAG